jgi:hypothetical protein
VKLYKHYKGKVYAHIADTETTSIREFYTFDASIRARHSEVLAQVMIYRYGNLYYSIDGIRYAVYVDGDGVIWARPYDMFHGHTEGGEKRFVEIL